MEAGREVATRIEMAHEMFRYGDFDGALSQYTEALLLARSTPQQIALHSNRAACFLKLHRFNQATNECTAVLQLDQNHAGALMLRAQTLVALKDYHSALFDVNRLLELNPSFDAYLNLEARLRTQLSLAPIPESDIEVADEEHEEETPLRSSQTERVNEEEFSSRKSIAEEMIAQAQRKVSNEAKFEGSKGWQTIPKPKGHSALDYGRWDRVRDEESSEDSEEDDDNDNDTYRFRVKTARAN